MSDAAYQASIRARFARAAIDALYEADRAVDDAVALFYLLAAEALPDAEVDALLEDTDAVATALMGALDDIEAVSDDDAPERAASLLRDLADRRAGRQEISRLRQDGAVLVKGLLDAEDDIAYERSVFLDELGDDDDES